MDLDPEFTLNALLLVGAISPFITAIAAKVNTPNWWKGVISITTSALTGVFQGFWAAGADFDVDSAVGTAVAVWATHLLTYFGISEDAVQRLHRATSNIGLPSPKGSHPIL